jgi:hypothetical protein
MAASGALQEVDPDDEKADRQTQYDKAANPH